MPSEQEKGPYKAVIEEGAQFIIGPNLKIRVEKSAWDQTRFWESVLNSVDAQGRLSRQQEIDEIKERWKILRSFIKINELVATLCKDEKQYERGRNALARDIQSKMSELEKGRE